MEGTTVDPIAVWKFITEGGSLATLAVIIGGLFRQLWVPGWIYREREKELLDRIEEVKAERNEWKDIARPSLSMARQLATNEQRGVTT